MKQIVANAYYFVKSMFSDTMKPSQKLGMLRKIAPYRDQIAAGEEPGLPAFERRDAVGVRADHGWP